MFARELDSQIERSQELYQELLTECKGHLGDEKANLRIPNITQDMIDKLRSILDQVIYSVFETKVKSTLSPTVAKKVKVYFPIGESLDVFNSMLGRSRLLNLENSAPRTYKIIYEAQPFVSHSKWLLTLRKLYNQKHIKLVRVSKQFIRATGLTTRRMPLRGMQQTSYKNGIFHVRIPVYRRSAKSGQNIRTGVTTEYLIWFEFENGAGNVLNFLDEAIKQVSSLAHEVINAL
ncbi:MAG: hypothetical protein HY070_08105 [Chloroflexi bacterium]|nr:hypothetical protein [Chloroflexota bacterium]